ncbi:hypothetical protein [Caldimonas sp. KR1-144]|uniref:hypothetical protein n=1 Tax=Caldimonas sp. KR1-144 TaxID=3400911 RepID=UPI003C09B067
MNGAASLNEQIAAAERRVIARDDAVLEQLHRLGGALRAEAANGLRKGALAAAATLGALVLFGLVGRAARRRARSPRAAAARTDPPAAATAARAAPAALLVAEAALQAMDGRHHRARALLPWPALVAMAWPLLPHAVTRRMTPRTAGVATALAATGIGSVVAPWWSRHHEAARQRVNARR